MKDQDRLLIITEVADRLRKPVATLRWWRHVGIGPRSFKIGRDVHYQESNVRAWVDRQHGQQSARPVIRATAGRPE